MKRRAFITVLGGAAATWPLAAWTQQSERVRRIGVLMGMANDTEGQARVAALQDGLKELGWIEGRNLQVEYRWTDGQPDIMRRYAAELVAVQAEAIMCSSTPTLLALRKETQTVPIVFVMVSDPVRMGHVQSMAQPGGNVTGFTPFEPSLGGKWVEVLKEIAPRITRAAILFNPRTAANAPSFVKPAESAGSSLGVSVVEAPALDNAEIERVTTEFAQQPGGGLIIVPDPFTSTRRDLIVAIAARHRLPLITPFRYFTTAGAILSYGVNVVGEHRRAAIYLDRILRGEKPADLPVQAPVKFELVINLKTAKALGLDVPPTLLARADEVIE